MIIFYNNKTGKIMGTVDGRVHCEAILKSTVHGDGIKPSEVGKYIVPFKTDYELVDVPITEMRVVDKKTMRVERVVVGKKKIKRPRGMFPDVPFAKLITDFESGKDNIYKYKADLDKKGRLIGFKKLT